MTTLSIFSALTGRSLADMLGKRWPSPWRDVFPGVEDEPQQGEHQGEEAEQEVGRFEIHDSLAPPKEKRKPNHQREHSSGHRENTQKEGSIDASLFFFIPPLVCLPLCIPLCPSCLCG